MILGVFKLNYIIDHMKDDNWPQVRAIYFEGIATGNATFETEAPAWEKWDANHLHDPRLVARDNERVLGWAVLSPVSTRHVYRGVMEVSVSVTEEARGHGVGRELLETLIGESEKNGIWMLQSAILAENRTSINLHLRCGFREVGRRERIGQLNGIWRDTLLLERRSAIAGTS